MENQNSFDRKFLHFLHWPVWTCLRWLIVLLPLNVFWIDFQWQNVCKRFWQVAIICYYNQCVIDLHFTGFSCTKIARNKFASRKRPEVLINWRLRSNKKGIFAIAYCIQNCDRKNPLIKRDACIVLGIRLTGLVSALRVWFAN